MSCIIGAIMYCSAAITVPGPVQSAQSYTGNDAWRYAAYYSPAVLNAGPLVIPAYANEVPLVFPSTVGIPAVITGRGYRS